MTTRPSTPARWRASPALWITAGLMLAHLSVLAINLSPLMRSFYVTRLFDVDGEANAVVWLSSATLLGIAGVAVANGWRAAGSSRVGWWVIGGGFVLLSLDETASLHETAGEIAAARVTIDSLPGGFMWVVVVAPVAAVGALWMMRFLGRTLEWRSRAGRMATLAIAVWLAVPMLEALAPTLGHPRGLILSEETTEGFGQALMAGALASHLFRRVGTVPPV